MAYLCTTAWTLLLVAASASAHVTLRSGLCPEPEVQQNFNISRYMGRWFEYMKFPWMQGVGTHCVIANYTLNPDNTVQVVNVAIEDYNLETIACPMFRDRSAVGVATVKDPAVPAKLGVSFSPRAPEGMYWVLETDYDNYSMVYSCTQYKFLGMWDVGIESAWILTRGKSARPANLDDVFARMRKADIDPDNFELSDQKGCPEWPKKN